MSIFTCLTGRYTFLASNLESAPMNLLADFGGALNIVRLFVPSAGKRRRFALLLRDLDESGLLAGPYLFSFERFTAFGCGAVRAENFSNCVPDGFERTFSDCAPEGLKRERRILVFS